MLQRMSTERLISATDAAAFAEQLPIHMRATDKDGVTFVDNAVMEHNVIAASRIYTSITFTSLGNLLGVDGRRAEKVTARMINDRLIRLAATIDQVDSMIDFAQGGASGMPDAAIAEILGFDSAVKEVCLSLNDICEGISAAVKTSAVKMT
jgi:COP9 signalosome complex subunit 4